jgi:multidrug resistance protein, MATE family
MTDPSDESQLDPEPPNAPDANDESDSDQHESPDSRILSGNLRTTVLILALPVLAEQMLSFLVGFTDTWLSGRISAQATSAIGVAAYVNWLGELLSAFVGTGATALIARHWGAGQRDTANAIARCAVTYAFIGGIFATAVVYFLSPMLGDFLGLEAESQDIAVRYLRIACYSQFFSSILMIGAASLRGSGNMTTPMMILGLVSVLNVIFSSALVMGSSVSWLWDFGVEGIAYGTIAARAVGAVLMLLALARAKSGLRATLRLKSLRDFDSLRRIVRIGGPVAFDGILLWVGHFLFLRIIAGVGGGDEYSRATFAAHIVGIQIEALNYLPAWAWGTAAATMIGQCLGGGKPERAKQSGHEAGIQAGMLGAVASLVFFFGASFIYTFMHKDPLVAEVGVPAMKILALFEIPLAVAIAYLVAIRGSGETLRPAVINFIGIFGIRLTCAYWLIDEMGLRGAWLAVGIDVTIRAIVIVWYFQRGNWLRKRI